MNTVQTSKSIFRLAGGRSLILASGSPRRRELLNSAGLDFSVRPPSGAEPIPAPGESGATYALRAACAKGQRAYETSPEPGAIVLSADTIVCIDGRILGKPSDAPAALDMLRQLNGRCHEVWTAFYLTYAADSGIRALSRAVSSQVQFGRWPDWVLSDYANTDEPLDKAGAYAAQGTGAFLVERIAGSWSNVVGLPLAELLACMLENGLLERQRLANP